MTPRPLSVLPVVVLLACSLIPLTAAAEPITFTESFNATGTVNGNPFDANVIFSLTTDTTLITGGGGIFLTPDGVASVTIQGVGSGTFTDPFDVFDNQGVSVAGFTDVNIEDIVDLSNSAFATYDLKSAIGPWTRRSFSWIRDKGLVQLWGPSFSTRLAAPRRSRRRPRGLLLSPAVFYCSDRALLDWRQRFAAS